MISCMEHLPQELVSNILSRLPARELFKCKCVCKFWFDLISDPLFVSNYYFVYNNCKSQKEERLLVISESLIYVLSWNVNEPKGLVSSSKVLTPLDEINFKQHKYRCWNDRIMGPCNGIYYLEGISDVMINPSLRQLKKLPKSQLTGSQATYSIRHNAGFGFDTTTNDYKVVVLKDNWLKETYKNQIGNWTVELYSLNSNFWRKLDASASFQLPIQMCSSPVYTYVNNCYHWWGFVDDSGGRTGDKWCAIVLAFNMVTESFRMIRAPKIRHSSDEYFITVAPSNDSATIGLIFCLRGTEKYFDVWVLKDYWDEMSWNKQYSVGPVPLDCNFVAFYGSNWFLREESNGRMVLYEPDSECTRDIQDCRRFEPIRATRYMESLFSLQRGNKSSSQ